MKHHRGVTLLEVVIGLALMGTLLSASLMAFSRHRRQLAFAEKRMEAIVVAEDLTRTLVDGNGRMPVGARGAVPGKPTWVWQTSPVGQTNIASLPIDVIRLQIIDAARPDVSLVSVDLFQRSRRE